MVKAWRVAALIVVAVLLVSGAAGAIRVANADSDRRCIDTDIGVICSDPSTDAATEFAQWLGLVALLGIPLGIGYVVIRNRSDDQV